MPTEKENGQNAVKKKAPLFSFKYFIYDNIRIGAGIPGLIWFRPKRIYAGKKPDLNGGVLVVSNHIGFLDPMNLMLILWKRRLHFICRKEFYDSPRSAFWFKQFLTIPVDRDNFGMDSFREITDRLEAGCAVGIFPEGHIDVDGDPIGSFKSGMVLMALRAGVPVLPVLLTERKKPFGRLTAVIGEPIDLKELGGERPSFAKVNEMTEYIKESERRLADLLPDKCREHTGKEEEK